MAEHMKVLITYDGINSIEKTIHDLKRSGLPNNVEATIYQVVDAFVPQSFSYADIGFPDSEIAYYEMMRQDIQAQIEQQLKQSKKQTQEAADRLKVEFPNWTVLSEAIVDSPASAILKKADKDQIDLIVVGSHGQSALARIFLGSVAQKVLTHSKCSVRIVRGQQQKDEKPIRLVIGFDGSSDAALAVAQIAGRSWPKGTEVKVVTAFDLSMSSAIAFRRDLPLAAGQMTKPGQKTGEKEWVRRATASSLKKLEATGLEVSESIKVGNPKQVVIQEAEAWNADCIFMGARGMGAIDRFLLGSVSCAVAARAHCSVEVIRKR